MNIIFYIYCHDNVIPNYIWYIYVYIPVHIFTGINLFLIQGKAEDSTDTGDEANAGGNKRLGKSFMGNFSKRKVVLHIYYYTYGPILNQTMFPPITTYCTH